MDRRVLGWLAPTRGTHVIHFLFYVSNTDKKNAAIGDAWLKLPAVYTEKVFVNIEAPWMHIHSLERYVHRIKTPPYVSVKPDVHYLKVRRDKRGGGPIDTFLITCSDGLVDLNADDQHSSIESVADRWVQVMGRQIDKERAGRCSRVNLAFKLLRDAIGGDDNQLSSRTMTVEMEEKWIDDTTIIIQRLI